MMVRMKVLVFGLLFVFGACVAGPSILEAAVPCCNVTAINVKTGLVTAKNLATGEILQFTVAKAAISKVKVGDKVSIDTMSGKVTVHGAEPVNDIKPAEPVSRPGVKPAEPPSQPQAPRLPGM